MSNARAIAARLSPLASAALLCAAGTWAFSPLVGSGSSPLSHRSNGSDRDSRSPAAAPEWSEPTPLPVETFRDEIWPDERDDARLVDAPPLASVLESPPLPITLLGVTRDTITGATRAAIYDADRDAVHIVGEGDLVGRVLVIRIDSAGVDISDAGRAARLNLRGDAR